MFEDSLEGFIARWRPYAAEVRLFARTEGSPLLECEAGGAILQVLERTGPYVASTGRTRLILNATTPRLERVESRERHMSAPTLGALEAQGTVLLREDAFVVVDAGAPLVVGVSEPMPDDIAAGDHVRFSAVPPVHGFVLREERRSVVRGEDAL